MTVTACPECSAVLEGDQNFCHACGADVREVTRAIVASDEEPANEAETTVMASMPTDADPTTQMAPAGDEDPTDPGPPPPSADATEVLTTTDSTACPNCGAPNSSRRTLCGRCGADLTTGEVAPRSAPRPIAPATPSEPRASERDRATRGRTVAIIVAAGILIGGLIGAAVALGLGPLGDGDVELPAASFREATYGQETTVLPLSEVATTTVLPPAGGVDMGRGLMFDGDLATAWSNSGDTNPAGEGEVIRVILSSPAWVTEIVVANGDQADAAAFASRARLHRVTAWADGNVVVGLVFLDSEGQQAVRFPEPVLTTAVRLEVTETFAGASLPDLAVSELSFRGHVADESDEALAEQRARLAPTPG